MTTEDVCHTLQVSETVEYAKINDYTRLFMRFSDEKIRLVQSLLEVIRPTPSDTVLEIGCGEGHLLKALSTRVKKCVGIEPDPAMVRVLRRKLSRARNVEIIPSRFEEYSGDGAFRHVVTSHTLSFFADKLAAIRKMIRLAAPKGWVVVVSHSTTSPQISMLNEFRRHSGGVPLAHVTAESICECLETSGLSPELLIVRSEARLPSTEVALGLAYFLFRVDPKSLGPSETKVLKDVLDPFRTNHGVRIPAVHGIIVLRT